MTMLRVIRLLLVVAPLAALAVGSGPDQDLRAEDKAIAFLRREVPAWRKENGCFSCHNNGDAARALYLASRQGFNVPAQVLAETTAWVGRPDQWDDNKGDPGFSDKQLADVQFASALLTAIESGHITDRKALAPAARRLVAGQAPDGSWRIDAGATLGSPATYGTPLATYTALKTLRAAGLAETREAERRAEQWLRAAPSNNILAASTLLLAFASATDDAARKKRGDCLALIRASQTRDGGWGPYRDAPPEAFDTAVALIALSALRAQPGVEQLIRRGRDFLIAQQQADGSWIETTRPAGSESYAQRLSTAGWATIALLATQD